MTEDLVKSSSSQRSNPRVLRRVRPVPYECCGGACSFLNSGCFTLCCNGRNTRRRSSVYVPRAQKEEEIQQEDEGRGQLSETTKRLIKPYSQDALNEDDLYVLEREFESECSDESTKKQNFVTSFDIDDAAAPPLRAESEEFLREEKVDREDEISVLTDDTSASAGDGSAKKKKKKKKILNILKIGRTKRKNKDGVSVTSSATSLACSEISEGNVEDLKVASTILEKTELSQSANGEKEKIDEVPPTQTGMAKEKGSFISRSLLSIFPSMRSKKGKKNDQINDDSKTDENHDSNVQKVIPLGFGVPLKTEDPPQRDLEVNLQMKPFWKTFSKRYKKKTKNEANKEIVYGIKPDDKKNQSNLEVGSDALKIFGPDTTKTEAQKVEPKKKTLLETLKFTKRDEHPPGQQNDQQKGSQIPCILSACVNSDIKPEDARRNSSDSIEVKTIVDGDLENDGNTIRIVRNEFFPTEVRTTDHHLASPDAGLEVVDKVETEVEEVDEEQIVSEDVEKIEQLVVDFQEKLENLQDSLVSAKKYEVFEKEDFSESLHTLVDEEDKDHILLAPASAITEILTIQDLQEEKSEEDEKPEVDESNLPEGIFRSSCRLSIEGSELILDSELEEKTEEAVDFPESNQEEINELEEKCVDLLEPQPEVVEESKIAVTSVENIISSSETLIETDVKAIEKSSETTQNPEGLSETTSWVEVANVEDLNDSQFDYIYKTTLKAVQNAGSPEVEQEGTTENIEESSPNDQARDEVDTEEVPNKPCSKEMEISCEVCGKSLQEEALGESKDNPGKTKCVCTTLTKPRQSLTEIEEGSVKSKVEALNKSKQPIIVPLSPVEFAKKGNEHTMLSHASAHWIHNSLIGGGNY